MPRRERSKALLVFALASSSVLALHGCEIILGAGSLRERPTDGAAPEDRSVVPDTGQLDAGSDSGSGGGSEGGSDSGPGDGGPDAGSSSGGDASSEGGVVALPNCQTGSIGVTSCGAASESCCISLEVEGGAYDRTYVNPGDGGTGGADPASVSGFRLDKYEVTVGRFRQFSAAWSGGWLPDAGSGKHTHLNDGQGLLGVGISAPDGGPVYEPGWEASDDHNQFFAPASYNLVICGTDATWTPAVESTDDKPVNCLTWWEAYAFCIWDGGFLPSEAEWEYAAAGGSLELEYPWGSTAPGAASVYAIYDCYYPSGTDMCTGAANIAPVGTATYPGTFGQLDLAGNVYEWNLDWYASSYAGPCTDCTNLAPANPRVLRGGSGLQTDQLGATTLLPPYRSYNTPSNRSGEVGFRCARAP